MIALIQILILTAFAVAKTILISDIDDTIKVSNVLDKDSAVANAMSTSGAFLGMAELYLAMQSDASIEKFFYLSNAPRKLMEKQHSKFLQRNNFPAGELITRTQDSSANHKANAIRKIIAQDKPSTLILIGDNGERDTETYARIRAEYPDLTIKTFIHLAYSVQGFEGDFGKPLLDQQSGFATSVDLAAQMMPLKLLHENSYTNMLRSFLQLAIDEGDHLTRGKQLMFPAWLDCRDMASVTLPNFGQDTEPALLYFENKLNVRCSRPPFED